MPKTMPKVYGDPVYTMRMPAELRAKTEETAKLAGFESVSDYNRQVLEAMNSDYPDGVYRLVARIAMARAQMALPFDSEGVKPSGGPPERGKHAKRAK